MQLTTKKFDFLFQDPPKEYISRCPEFLYNRDDYVELFCPSGVEWVKFYVVDHHEKAILGNIQFILVKEHQHQVKTAYSPYKAPFGSFVLAEEVTGDLLENFLKFVILQLGKEGVTQIQIKNFVQAYGEYQSNLIRQVLTGNNFDLVENWPNHHIKVDTPEIMDKTGPYALPHKEKCRLRKCIREGFDFQKLSHDHLSEVYNFIDGCRKEKNQNLSLSFNHLKKLVKHFPDNYPLFAVFDGSKIISTIITVKVNQKALYYFLPAYDIVYKSYSPTVLLIAGIYQYCYQEGIEVLDMGLSDTIPLSRFKKHMGGIEDEKITYGKNL